MMNGLDMLNLVYRYASSNPIELYISSADDSFLKDSNLKYIKFLNKPVSKGEIKVKLLKR